jgi:carbon monoxide dehydrogenase subunit G
MAMEISKTFVVNAPADAVWAFLTDPQRVARNLPGAAITNQVDEQTHAGTITVKVGPVAAAYKGTMRFERLDAATRTAEIVAAGQDVRGKGGADMRMTSRLVEREAGVTEVAITSQVNVMGILAQFGRGMIQDVSDQMFDKFVAALRLELETPTVAPASHKSPATPGAVPSTPGDARPTERPSAEPIEVLSFGSAVAGRAASRAVRRPVFWIAVLILVVIYWLWLH